ncbi:hypothetical protein evm_001669 [Chilo suppressalis]|nr:hypothetical protein evm_001669 [Chilo suppressalis]
MDFVVAAQSPSSIKPAPTARPLSPSRVILTKFFRASRTSTKATDSQETKFALWKVKKVPPALPPIDFDL